MRVPSAVLLAAFTSSALACSPSDEPDSEPARAPATTQATPDWDSPQDTTDRVAIASGFSGPEAVRYDPEQDVYFVSNFNGDGGERDANGFISRMGSDGVIQNLRFITGTGEAPLHAPRGMNIRGDTLWVADVDGVHGFHRVSGQSLAFTDFRSLEPGFLNDIAIGPDGTLYVTDTGSSVVYSMRGQEAAVAARIPEEGRPNGITWDGTRLLTVAWGGGQTLYAIDPTDGSVEPWAQSSGGFFDGIELVGTRAIVASQADSSLHVVDEGTGRALIRVGGAPADIALDTRRNRVAVPYISLDRVDIWQLPQG